MKKVYFWTEDREGKSGYTFWQHFLSELFPAVILESKGNNARLLKAVKTITDNEALYIIAMDNSYDNPDVIKLLKELKRIARERSNIVLLDLVCFEFLLLEFKQLLDWVYAKDDEYRLSRTEDISAREAFVSAVKGNMDYNLYPVVKTYLQGSTGYNAEKVAAKILYGLTRNTGFEVSKSMLGECWWKDCCQWSAKDSTDKCGLDLTYLTCHEKMLAVLKGTSLEAQVGSFGMEVQQ